MAFRSNRTTGRLPQKRYGLSDEKVKELRDVVNPGSLHNLFRPVDPGKFDPDRWSNLSRVLELPTIICCRCSSTLP